MPNTNDVNFAALRRITEHCSCKYVGCLDEEKAVMRMKDQSGRRQRIHYNPACPTILVSKINYILYTRNAYLGTQSSMSSLYSR